MLVTGGPPVRGGGGMPRHQSATMTGLQIINPLGLAATLSYWASWLWKAFCARGRHAPQRLIFGKVLPRPPV